MAGKESKPFERDPSVDDSAIQVSDVRKRLPRLQAKLAEYKSRLPEDLGYMHPGYAALVIDARVRLAPATLEAILTLATGEHTRETDKVYLHDVAVLVQDATRLDVVRAATIPFRYNWDGMVYEPDMPRLLAEAGPDAMAFADIYRVQMAYCSGNMWGVEGGTGLPEA